MAEKRGLIIEWLQLKGECNGLARSDQKIS